MNEPTGPASNESRPPLVIITGLSGAGKSTATRVYEDLGWYCVDNLPPALIPDFYDLYERSGSGGAGVVVASDVRSGALFDDLEGTLTALAEDGVEVEVLYLDAATHVLINRYKEVRRSHPLQGQRPVEAAIDEERRRLEPVRAIATRVVDTSTLDSHGLADAIASGAVGPQRRGVMRLELTSFGFKYGLPRDADFVFDVRFLPNPHYIAELRPLTGEDDRVYDHVMGHPESEAYFQRIVELIDATLEPYLSVGKRSLALAVGCTGGRHRSVSFVRRLAAHFDQQGLNTRVSHRDAAKPTG